jgi:hypothetical protein
MGMGNNRQKKNVAEMRTFNIWMYVDKNKNSDMHDYNNKQKLFIMKLEVK